MDIQKIDKNFTLNNVTRTDVSWFNPKEKPFSIHGLLYDNEVNQYTRMPLSTAITVSPDVHYLARFNSGGRIRFKTNSDFIALKVIEAKYFNIMLHMPIAGEYGFSVYVDKKYLKFICPSQTDIVGETETITFDGLVNLDGKLHDIEIYFPLYYCVKEVLVGLNESSSALPPDKYTYPKPVVFYGSSITQGAAASHAGNDYVNLLSRLLDTDIINLGFSGNAKGEQNMAKYISSLDTSVIVLDYDYNAPTVEHLENTHYPFYQTIRKNRPDTPIIFISKPDFENGVNGAKRRDVILASYKKAISSGDKLVDFIDGQTLFGTENRDCCTVDGGHPNDLGFYRMATTIMPTLKKWLEK